MINRLCSIAIIAFLLLSQSVFAWDAVGHRLTAAVALNFMTADTTEKLIVLLEQHPRFSEDFQNAMPASVANGDEATRQQWLLGQAAYWPDIARGLPDAERRKYNRPPWHYTDGAWVRDSAPFQGNSYVGIEPFPNIEGPNGDSIRSEDAVTNVVTGIDYNTWVVANDNLPPAQRAVALCWVLHLMGDIHMPLHTGSMYSAHTFERGDLGGNRIPVGDRNLHGRWDSALSDTGVANNLPLIIQQVSGFNSPRIQGVESDWTQWMNESRQFLQTSVYTEEMRQATAQADAEAADDIATIQLSEDYVEQMQRISRQRIGLAGLRLAIWFENTLP